MKRILGIVLIVMLLLLPFSSVYALETPQQPQLDNFTTNEEIKDYNNKVEQYNIEVDKYNATVDEEYKTAVDNANQQNEAGLKTQEETQKAHDDAIAANEQATADANRQNEEIDKQNEINKKEVEDWNTAEDNKAVERQQEISNIVNQNEQNKNDIEAWNKTEDDKVNTRQQEINSVNESNKAVQEHNTQEQAKVEASEKAKADAEQQNINNEAEVNAHNAEELKKENEYNAAVEAAYQIALQAEADRVAQLEAENEAITAANQAELDRVAAENKANDDEKARIDAANEAAQTAYEAEKARIESENAAAQQAYETEKARIEAENNAAQTAYETEKARIEAANKTAVDTYEAEKARIEKENKDTMDAYNAEVSRITAENEELLNNYKDEVIKVNTHNTFVDNVDAKIEQDDSEARGFTNYSTTDTPTDWSDNTDESSLKTIQIEKSDTPTGEKIKVINLHLFLDESYPYSPDCYQTYIENNSFELDEEMKNRAVLTEWETAEIDYDDTVTMSSEASSFAGNIVWLNGKRQWFGTDPKPYFFRAIEGYTQGYWTPGGSMLATTATVQEEGWTPGGETYTAQYAEETAYSSYLYNGQPMVEEIKVRTTDKQEPKNIFTIFTYLFTRLAPEPEKQELPDEPTLQDLPEKPVLQDLPEEPVLQDLPTPPTLQELPTEPTPQELPQEPTLETFTPNPVTPAVIQDLNEIVPNTITKGELYEKDLWEYNPISVPEIYVPSFLEEQAVPDVYSPQYKTFVPADIPEEYVPIYKTYTEIEHIIPVLTEIPSIIYWTLINPPAEPTHLTHLSLLDLLPEPDPIVPEPDPEPINPEVPDPEPIDDPTPGITPTPVDNDPTPTVPIYGRGDDPEEVKIATTTPATIINQPTPKANPEIGSWALINLIATILSCVIAIILAFVKKKTDDEKEEYTDEEKKDIRGLRRFKIYSILVGIISIIAFILTEDMTLPMVLIDKWTILMLILLLVNIINIFIMRKKSKQEDEDDDK